MKVLLCTKDFADGGVTKAFIEVVNFFKRNNIDYEILVESCNGVYQDYFNNENVIELKFKNSRLKRLIYFGTNMNTITNFDRLLIFLNLVFTKLFGINVIYKIANRNVDLRIADYDVVIDFHGYGYFLTYFVARNFEKSRKYSWVHDERIHTLKYIVREFEKFDAICCVSMSCKTNLERAYGFLKNIIVIHNIININGIKNKSNERSFEYDKKTIVSIGRLENQKGFDIVPDIAKRLKEKNFNFKWIIIGDGSLYNDLQLMIEQKQVQDNVELLGFKENPLAYVKNAFLYVQPSLHEGFPTTVSEALVLKKVIVGTNIPSIQEAVQGVNFELLVSRDINMMSKVIIDLFENESLYNKYLDVSRNAIINNFTNELNELIRGGSCNG